MNPQLEGVAKLGSCGCKAPARPQFNLLYALDWRQARPKATAKAICTASNTQPMTGILRPNRNKPDKMASAPRTLKMVSSSTKKATSLHLLMGAERDQPRMLEKASASSAAPRIRVTTGSTKVWPGMLWSVLGSCTLSGTQPSRFRVRPGTRKSATPKIAPITRWTRKVVRNPFEIGLSMITSNTSKNNFVKKNLTNYRAKIE